MNNVAIITAGGSGNRLNSNIKKQFIKIKNRPLLFWTLDKFIEHPQIDKIVIVVPKSDEKFAKNILEKEYSKQKFILVIGGDKRQDSVFNALSACPKDTCLVLIHDGVRPFITATEISNLIELAKVKKTAIPISPIVDTIKEVEENIVQKTVCREKLFKVFTPQVFDFKLIKKFSEKAIKNNIEFTDDASILEYYGVSVNTKICSARNFKITDEFDLKLAKIIIKNEDKK